MERPCHKKTSPVERRWERHFTDTDSSRFNALHTVGETTQIFLGMRHFITTTQMEINTSKCKADMYTSSPAVWTKTGHEGCPNVYAYIRIYVCTKCAK